jgi:lysozyme
MAMNAANAQLQYTGQTLTEQFEGCALAAYQDTAGVWTIGYGHTAGVQPGDVCTQAQADTWLTLDIQWAAATVRNLVGVPLRQDEFNALVDFVFNVGSGAFAGSTLLADLNGGDYVAAAAQFQRWDTAGGAVVAGLLRRRIAEENEFND